MAGEFRRYSRKTTKREKDIEKSAKKRHIAAGGLAYKFVSPGNAGVPDDIFLQNIPVEHREIVSRYIRFVEYKRPGGLISPLQAAVHADLRALGFSVVVIDSDEDPFNV